MYKTLLVGLLLGTTLLGGCRSTSGDRLPSTAVDNPDPIFGGTSKAKTANAGNEPAQSAPGTPTSQRGSGERIGPLSFPPNNTASPPPAANPGTSTGTAMLTSRVRPPVVEPVHDQQVQPAANTVPASNPAVVQEYRQRMNKYGVAGLSTKALGNGTWEAIGHFPSASQPNQLRRIEAQGATEADALLAILEQLEKPQ